MLIVGAILEGLMVMLLGLTLLLGVNDDGAMDAGCMLVVGHALLLGAIEGLHDGTPVDGEVVGITLIGPALGSIIDGATLCT